MQENLQIFLIDDDADDQEIFSVAVQDIYPSAKCIFASDGVDALKKLNATSSFAPNIIFIDINMPRMNGMQCLAELKKISAINHIPVYMYSTSADPAMIKECLHMGATGFIKKEIKVPELQKKLLQILLSCKTQFD